MKLKIKDTEYDYKLALQKAKLTDLYDLKVAANIGARSILAMLTRLDDAKTVEEALDVSEEPDVLIATQGLVFLCQRFAGEKVSFDDSAVAWEDLQWCIEDSDRRAEAEPDPTQALAAEPAQGSDAEPNVPVPTSSPKKSKTSKPRSTSASS